MLETLLIIAIALFLLGLAAFGFSLMRYVLSGRYELDQRIDRYCK